MNLEKIRRLKCIANSSFVYRDYVEWDNSGLYRCRIRKVPLYYNCVLIVYIR